MNAALSSANDSSIELSLILPARNEAANLESLLDEIAETLDGRAYEVIVVDDGSTDDSRAVLAGLRRRLPQLRVLCHRVSAGQSRAVQTGVAAARAPVIATLDADGQNDPADLMRLYAHLTRHDAPADLALVQGERRVRSDGAAKRWASFWANRLRARLLGDGARDSGCATRVFRREAFLALPYFDHMHRFLPALMKADGRGVEFCPVNHRERLHGRSNYRNWSRLKSGIVDILGVLWLKRRRKIRPGMDEI